MSFVLIDGAAPISSWGARAALATKTESLAYSVTRLFSSLERDLNMTARTILAAVLAIALCLAPCGTAEAAVVIGWGDTGHSFTGDWGDNVSTGWNLGEKWEATPDSGNTSTWEFTGLERRQRLAGPQRRAPRRPGGRHDCLRLHRAAGARCGQTGRPPADTLAQRAYPHP